MAPATWHGAKETATTVPAAPGGPAAIDTRETRDRQLFLDVADSSPRDLIELISVARRLRIDDVGCLPQRVGYPVPQPHLLKLLHQLGEQLTQRRQVKHSWLAVAIHHSSGLGGGGRTARLVGDMADDGLGKARSIGQADVVAVEVNVRAGRPIGSDRWWRVLRHRNHPLPEGRPA